jgi:hypothetical protein
MRQRGLTAHGLIEGWSNVERQLAEGDGINVIKGIVAGYNIDPSRVAEALGVAATRQAPASDAAKAPSAAAPAAQEPPEILQEVARLRQRADTEDRARAEAMRATQAAAQRKFVTELEEFKNAQDDRGDLLHPHVAQVAEDMAHLAYVAQGQRPAGPVVAGAL